MDSQASQSSTTSFHKVIIQSSSYGPMDNFIVCFLSKEDLGKFYILLIRLTVSCGWALSWVNNPEAQELFNFLNPLIKLPDRYELGGKVLTKAVEKVDNTMEIALKEDPVGITLTFDGWTNVKNEQLLGAVLISSEGKPYVWKAVDSSIELQEHMQQLELQYEIYEKHIIPIVSVETRWNSIYEMCLSLIKTQQALQVKNHHKKDGELTISHVIFEIIDSNNFWDNLVLFTEILDPYCRILNVLQSDKACLFQVIHGLQLLLILSCLLHPKYKMECFNKTISNFNYSIFGKWFIYYYNVWSDKEPKCIIREFDDFHLNKYPFDIETYKQFNWRYWCYIGLSTNELGFVACRIFGIYINATSVERLWSCMRFLQTNRRNRLKVY
ncbi:ribonuclease H-like domain-containing protein [Glomus cerebriforme]|uniref:Ribonuclease H-like domain-containing protein n=1 Tax=Glomus cerebriforme TaxID=658196 RepID=A0A397SUI9_9GLOM|nr:ribonuclease H-like domain-containing protein [Glomus cerebriforme]